MSTDTRGGDVWAPIAEHLSRIEDDGFSGLVRVTRGPDVLFESCHGLADRAAGLPVHPGTRFAVASLCKMFTAAGVLDAVRRGALSLTRPVVDILPPELRPTTLDPGVTVHHLLTHTSGIADYFEEDEDLPDYQEDYEALWTDLPAYRVRRPADFLPLFADLPAIQPPGVSCRYSNAGYLLLGLVLEQVSGTDFVTAVTERVLRPVGMAASGYFAVDEVHPDLAVGYLRPQEDGMPWRSNIYAMPPVGGADGGAYCTAADIERFLRNMAAGELLGPELREAMLTQQVMFDEDKAAGWGMGYGVYVNTVKGVFLHDGGDPGVESLGRLNTRTDTAIVLLASVEGFVDALGDLVIDTLEGPGSE